MTIYVRVGVKFFIIKATNYLPVITLFCINNTLFLFRILLKDELIVVQTEDDFKKILEDSRGKQNVILTNVKEIGMKGAEKT